MKERSNIPTYFRSELISSLKSAQPEQGSQKIAKQAQEKQPIIFDRGKVVFKLPRRFGFCFGVENALDTAYQAIEENPGRRVFLLSEMIHNPVVTADLVRRGVKLMIDASGRQLVSFSELNEDDVVIIPAFGTTCELAKELEERGVIARRYDATCPFVKKVWRKAEWLGNNGFSIVIHGKSSHEETKATFSHASAFGPSLIIRDQSDADFLARYILEGVSQKAFETYYRGRHSTGFDVERDLSHIGVVNQTTLLVEETKRVSESVKSALVKKFGQEQISSHYAETNDTLCYATSENQAAIKELISSGGDLAVVVGGYNSSNTAHLAELCRKHMPTFHICDEQEIHSSKLIRHLVVEGGSLATTQNWLPLEKERIEVLVASGASCPDRVIEKVIQRITEILY